MPEIIHNFTQGRMNKDIDERMIPDGEYRDALNITVATSEDSHVGALQNVKGNTQRKGMGSGIGSTISQVDWSTQYIDSLTNPVCIGSIRHEPTECIYWFITSDASSTGNAISAIAEYNTITKVVVPVIVDTKNILKFNSKYHITGINIVDDLLFWTDNNSEPKKINIKKFKTGSTDFSTHSKIPTYNTTNLKYVPPLGDDFIEADVTVIKKSPLTAPVLDLSESLAGGPGTGTSPLITTYGLNDNYNFTYITTPATDISYASYRPFPTYQEYIEVEGTADAYPTTVGPEVVITVNTAPNGYEVGDVIVLTGSVTDDYNNVDEYTIRMELVNINGTQLTCNILSMPSEIVRQGDDMAELISWEVLLEEKDPMFEFVFPRFAYRWKYQNGEYSCFSPFTEVAFLGDKFEYLSSDGYNLGMRNNIRSLIVGSVAWGSEEVIELDILYKTSTSNNIYIVDTLKDRTKTSLKIKSELIGRVVESNQLLRPWDNVPRKALGQEISANRLIYANYLQNYNVDNVDLIISESPTAHPGIIEPEEEDGAPNSENIKPYKSIKSIRTYQAGVIFQDLYGRQTAVKTSKDATVKIDKDSAGFVNKLNIKCNSSAPDWATHYKYFIKDISNEYYNLALDRYYFAEDGNVWLSFPSSEVNKVKLDGYLVLKKQHDNNNPSVGPCRYKVLDVKNEAPEFIATTKTVVATAVCNVMTGFQQDYSTIQFHGPGASADPSFANAFGGDRYISIEANGGGFVGETANLKIESGGISESSSDDVVPYNVTLEEKLGATATWMGTGGGMPADTQVTIKILKDTLERKPEFEGRFFVKINRDTDFDMNIIKPFTSLEVNYSVVAGIFIDRVTASNDSVGNSEEWGYNFIDPGETTGVCQDAFKYRRFGMSNGGNGEKLHGWTYSPQDSDGTIKFNTVYDTPAYSRKYLGIGFVGTGASGSQTVSNFNTANQDSLYNVPDTNYHKFMMESAIKGALLRIVPADSSIEPTKNYPIANHWRIGKHRGEKDCWSGNQRNKSGNKQFAIALELEDAIEETWVGDGGAADLLANVKGYQIVEEITSANNKILTSTNPAIFETEPDEAIDMDIYYEATNALPISTLQNSAGQTLSYFNCYSFGNGVESNRIRDDFNAPKIDKGVKVSTIFDGPYAEERRGTGLIFSQIYNSMSGINRTNQFIIAEPITKDLNPEYGSIQKLHSRNTNLITLCEDKCLQILANKDALFEAGGNAQLVSNNKVLGQAIAYAGEFGISNNPESFTSYGFRSYFADKNRGAIIRLSQDGITNIALKGMADFFTDNLPLCTKLIGSFDDDKENYNITLDTLTAEWQDKLSKTPKDRIHCEVTDDTSDNVYSTTLSFKETVGGWTSRKSYYSVVDNIVYPLESAVSINDKYYTFNQGLIWEEYSNDIYGNIYGTQYDSSVNVVLNDATETIKGFKTLNFSGSNSRQYTYGTSTGLSGLSIDQLIYQQISPSIINSETLAKTGWYTNYINTDIEEGSIKEFKKKENKWFQKIKGLTNKYVDNCDNNIDSSSFPVQGLGNATITSGALTTYNITVNVDADCSTTGVAVPSTESYFWYRWSGAKGPTDIRPEATDQLAKCAIEGFYNGYEPGETNIDKTSQKFKHLSGEGVNVDTYLYNEYDDQLISSEWDGKYLYLSTQSDPSNDALNANVPGTIVPDTYYVITISGSQITAKTQYNTLDACVLGPDTTFTAHLGYFKNIAGQGNYQINWRYYSAALSSGTWNAKAVATKDQIMYWLNSSSIVNQTGLGYFTYNYKYLASDGLAVGSTLYKNDGTALDTSLNDGIIVYRTDQVAGNIASPLAARELLMNNATWAALPNTYKFIAFENGVITLVKNMNEI